MIKYTLNRVNGNFSYYFILVFVNSISALNAAAATGLPPRGLRFVIHGIPDNDNICFDSYAPTNPTGKPITSAGRGPFSFHQR